MPVRHAHWYTLNDSREYPVDETASCRADDGERLPTDVLVDLRLRWPSYLGRYAFIGGVSITPYAASITLQASTTLLNDDSEHTPLAVLTVARADLKQGRAYALQPQVDGVYGYAVFGNGITREYQGRFSTPAQTILTPRAARAYLAPPVTGMRRVGNQTSLTGLIRLKGEAPLEIVKEAREIDGILRDVAVIRLVNDPAGVENVFETYAGPCGGRPESRSCPDPQPIEFINAVGPDCDGVLELEFKGCAIAGHLVDDLGGDAGGVVIDCALGLGDSCLPSFLPDHEGRLPSEYHAFLVTASESDSVVEDELALPTGATVLGELPYSECFVDGVADDFAVLGGSFTFERDSTRPASDCLDLAYDLTNTYATLSLAQPNISLWKGFDVSTLFRKYTAVLKLLATTGGLNGGLVLNFRPHQTVIGRNVYYHVNIESGRVAIYRFNGFASTLLAATSFSAAYDTWYTLTAKTWVADGRIWLQVDAPVSLGPVVLSEYMPEDGHSGVGSNYGKARFAKFKVEVYEP